MQVNLSSNKNFGARLSGDFNLIKNRAIKNGFRYAKANEIEKGLKSLLPDNCTISFFKPQEGSVTGRVLVENWKGSGVDMEIRPVLMGKKNLLVRYKEAAETLSAINFRRNNGIHTIA